VAGQLLTARRDDPSFTPPYQSKFPEFIVFMQFGLGGLKDQKKTYDWG
jgi:hypothetical protein